MDAGLADGERWPELAMPSSPAPSDDESNPTRPSRPSGFPGATGLKYTTTILGPSRSGALGLRVTGKRGSISVPRRQSVRRSLSQPRPITDDNGEKVEPDATPTLPASASPRNADVMRRIADVEIKVDEASPVDKDPVTSAGQPSPAPTMPGANPPPPAMIPIPFIPKFKGAAEMEARRQLRMRNRVPPGGAPRAQVPAPAYLNPEMSSSSSSSALSVSDIEDNAIPEEDEEEDDDDDELDDEDNVPDDAVDMMGDDVFDPLVLYILVQSSCLVLTDEMRTVNLQVVEACRRMACQLCPARNR